jgi:hypothetical protein
MTREEAAALKSNMHATFDSPQGKEVMRYIEKIGNWMPTMFDEMDTNSIVARDANRRLIGTIKTIMEISPDQIEALTGE